MIEEKTMGITTTLKKNLPQKAPLPVGSRLLVSPQAVLVHRT
jgi:hypothetical protein